MSRLTTFADSLNLWEIKDFSIPILYGILKDSTKYYRTFKIPKRRDGYREINSPYPILIQIQQALLHKLQDQLIIHEHAYAYRKGKNAIMHASSHIGSKELLTVDIQDFFTSTTRQQIHEILLANNLDKHFAHIASLIATYKDILPQGAPTSPLLSNAVLNRADNRLSNLSSLLGLTYTRYADDLAFSGTYIPRNLSKLIDKILSENGYTLNPKKTMLKTENTKKIITGVSISSGVAKVPRAFVRSTRAAVHNLEKNLNRLSSQNELDPLAYERVLGKLNYWLQVDPTNPYATQKKKILSEAHQKFLRLSAKFSLRDYFKDDHFSPYNYTEED